MGTSRGSSGLRRVASGVAALAAVLLVVAALAMREDAAPGGAATHPAGTGRAGDSRSSSPRARAATATPSDGSPSEVPDATTWRGRVVTGVERDPVEGAVVELVRVDPASRVVRWTWDVPDPRAEERTATDADGRFLFAVRAGEAWHVRVARRGFMSATRRVDADGDVVLVPATRRTVEVTSRDGKPVAGASVLAAADWPEDDAPPALAAFRTTTDEHGVAAVDVAEEAGVIVFADGFALREESFPHARGPLRVVLDRGAEVGGTVVDTSGAPLAGVRVRLDRDESWDHQAARTDDDGAFRFAWVDAGDTMDLHVAVDAPGRVRVSEPARPGDTDLRVVVPRAGSVSGVVVGEDGAAAVGAWVGAARNGVHSGADGTFRIDGVAPGRYVVAAHGTEDSYHWRASEVVDVAEGADLRGVRLVLRPDRDVSFVAVRIVHPDGSPAPQGWATAYDGRDDCGVGHADAEGRAVLRVGRPPASVVDVSATAPSPGPPEFSAEVRGVVTAAVPPEEAVVLSLGPPGVVAPRFVDDRGEAVDADAVSVTVRFRGSGGIRADPRGIPVEPRAPASLTFSCPGHGDVEVLLDPPHPPRREILVVLPREVAVTGRVVLADGRAPGPACRVHLATWAGDHWAGSDLVPADDGGRFAARGFGPGRLYAWVEIDGRFRLRWIGGEVAAGARVAVPDLVVAPLRRLDGIVAGPDGSPVGGALVEIVRDDQVVLESRTTDSAGRFDADLPADLPVTLRVQRRGRATTFVPVPAGGTGVRVAMAPECLVVVRTPKEWRYTEFAAEFGGARWEPDTTDPADVDERTIARTLRGLPAGTIVVRPRNGPGGERTVVTSPGAVPVVVFEEP